MRDGTGTSRHTNDDGGDSGNFIDFSFMKNEQRNLEKEESIIYTLF